MMARIDRRSTLSETKIGSGSSILLRRAEALWVPRIENSILQMIGTGEFSITSIFGLFASRTFLACSGCTDDRRRKSVVLTTGAAASGPLRLSHATLLPRVPGGVQLACSLRLSHTNLLPPVTA